VGENYVGERTYILLTGNSINLTAELNTPAINITNSINWAYTSPTASLNVCQIPLLNITSSYKSVLPTSPINHTGSIFTFVNTTASTITASTIVGFDDLNTNVNGVKPYSNPGSETGNCCVLGVCIQDSTAGNSCFVLSRGFTTCRNQNTTVSWTKGQVVKCGLNGEVISGAVSSNDALIGYAMETTTLNVGDGLLVWINKGMGYEMF